MKQLTKITHTTYYNMRRRATAVTVAPPNTRHKIMRPRPARASLDAATPTPWVHDKPPDQAHIRGANAHSVRLCPITMAKEIAPC
jgi:hypothetical protein